MFFIFFRFAGISVGESASKLFCEIKQKNDQKEQAGEKFLPKKIETENGEEPYRDLLKNRVDIIQKNRKILLDNREKKMRTKNFKESVRTIPNVLYNPHTALQLMKSTEGGNLFSNAIKYNTENSSVIFYDTVIDDYENENSNNNNQNNGSIQNNNNNNNSNDNNHKNNHNNDDKNNNNHYNDNTHFHDVNKHNKHKNNIKNNDKNENNNHLNNINNIKSFNTTNIKLKHTAEKKYLNALKSAKHGNEKSLFNFFIAGKMENNYNNNNNNNSGNNNQNNNNNDDNTDDNNNNGNNNNDSHDYNNNNNEENRKYDYKKLNNEIKKKKNRSDSPEK